MDKGQTLQSMKLLFFELMVQLVNSHIITKTIKVAAENAAVIWTSDSTVLVKVKRVQMCVFLSSCQLLLLSSCPLLTEGRRLHVTEFHTFYKHPLASAPSIHSVLNPGQ